MPVATAYFSSNERIVMSYMKRMRMGGKSQEREREREREEEKERKRERVSE
jgi:hypothetical protein